MIDRTELMGELVDVVADMRKWQRKFFRAKPHTDERYRALLEAKKFEKRADELVQLLKTSPPAVAHKGPLL